MQAGRLARAGRLLFLVGFFILTGSVARAADGPGINSGDTAFMLVATALVMLMTPGLAFFYGGLVRRKNVLATMMHSLVAVAIISIQWVLWGYSLAFGPDVGGVTGSLAWLGLRDVGMAPNPAYAPTIPHQLFMIYQCMFAVITPALISGAMAERMNFRAYVLFLLLWATFVYDPVCHWVWGDGGWLKKLGALDFAGGIVVHLISGVTALVTALILGRRIGFPTEQMMPHNLPFTILGAGILWFGWFGFNAGSALAAGNLSVTAFVATNTAGASAALTWIALDWVYFKEPTALGTASGAVAGLATVTPAAGFVSPLAALVIGVMAGAACRQMVLWRSRRQIDDSLDAFGVHGVGGATGVLATGLFASVGATGLLLGNFRQFGVQVVAIAVTAAYALIVSWVILKVLDATVGLRVGDREETEGLDLSQHGEAGYSD